MNTTKTNPILCGTDFSENARRAAIAAAALASRLGAPLLLVHAGGLPLEGATSEAEADKASAPIARVRRQVRRMAGE